MMPLKAYIEDQPRISRHFRGDMRPDDATEDVYRGSAAHISSPPSAMAAYGRTDAFSARIGKKEKSGMRYPRGELSSYAQRRGSVDVSAHGPFNIRSERHHPCAEASVRQRLRAQEDGRGKGARDHRKQHPEQDYTQAVRGDPGQGAVRLVIFG